MSLTALTWRSAVACACVWTTFACANQVAMPASPPRTNPLVTSPLMFEANQGQADPRVKFVSRGPGHQLLLTSDDAILQVGKSERSAAVTMHVGDGTAASKIEPLEPQPGQVNYLLGNDPANWHLDVPHYARVRYREVYPGVDLIFYGNQQQLEYDLVVSPGADPRAIAVRFDGAERLQLTARGDLLIDTIDGQVEQAKPLVYQEIDGNRKYVDAAYILKSPTELRFQVATYDQSRALVIDPTVFFSYLGGGGDEAKGLSVDSTGNVYVAGVTRATNFPTTGPFQGSSGGGLDGFITKFGPGGSPMIFSTYLGGSGDDGVSGIAVGGRAGNVYAAGYTSSSNFPTFIPLQASNAGEVDEFVLELNAAGNGFVFSTYVGGAGEDRATGICLGPNDEIFTTGYTASSGFPTVNPLQGVFGGGPFDAFATLINPAGTQINFSTFVGGADADQAMSAVYDPSSGRFFVSGGTSSTNFPTTPGAYQTTNNGLGDVFLTSLDASGAMVTSTYIGGNQNDIALGMAVGPNGLIGLTGRTSSPDFPLVSPHQPRIGGLTDAFVLEVNAGNRSPSVVTFSTFLGGSGNESGNAISFDPPGNIAFAGGTGSRDFPVFNADQSTFAGGSDDCFFGVFSVAPGPLPRLAVLSFFGGPGPDAANVIWWDTQPATNRFYVGGRTEDRGDGKSKAFLALLSFLATR